MAHGLKVGDTVKLKPSINYGIIPEGRVHNPTAKVAVLLGDMIGGIKLNQDLGGMLYWNEDDLVFVKGG